MEGISVDKRKQSLDALYTALSNLDKDFARSSKTRTAFIDERFGGSFADGSIVLLDYINGAYESADDIKKLSFIRDTVDKLEANYADLDSLPNFSFDGEGVDNSLLLLLSSGEYGVNGPVSVVPDDLKAQVTANHYSITPKTAQFVPKAFCKKILLFSIPMKQWAGLITGHEFNLTVGDTLEVKNGRLCLTHKQ